MQKIIRQTFRPEFLNRIDDTIIFQHLTEEEIALIASLQLKFVAERLAKKNISVEFTDAVSRYIAKAGYDKVFGARPLKRLIQNEILDELSLQIVEGKIMEGDTVKIDYGTDGVAIGKKN